MDHDAVFSELRPAECLAALRDVPDDQVMYIVAGDLRALGVSVPADVPAARPVDLRAGTLRAAISDWIDSHVQPADDAPTDQPAGRRRKN